MKISKMSPGLVHFVVKHHLLPSREHYTQNICIGLFLVFAGLLLFLTRKKKCFVTFYYIFRNQISTNSVNFNSV